MQDCGSALLTYKLLSGRLQDLAHHGGKRRLNNVDELKWRFVYATADKADAYMFYRCFLFFFCFFRPSKNMRQPFSGTAERICMEHLPNDTGENGVCNVVPPPGEWRMLMI